MFILTAYAQNPTVAKKIQTQSTNNTNVLSRCATSEGIKHRMQTDRAYYEAFQRKTNRSGSGNLPSASQETRMSRLNSIVTIPVVVHIVLPNPSIVTDEDVQYFIDRLNLDFSGLNPDSTNAVDFYNLRGHSLIRFALAKRDPNGKPTTGIERRVGNGTINIIEPQPIKNRSQGGLNPWPHTQYYNLWVGIGSGGVLGIAPEIGPGTASTDGVCIDYRAFANNSCYSEPNFNLARTAVHEIGHNFGLYHIFEGGCTDNDFDQITSPSLSLPSSLLKTADDTPSQNKETTGCPTSTQASNCAGSTNPPGKMYQNFMDYTNDACYSMFTKGQVERMHYVLENFRSGYLTTQGHIPVSTASLDASAYESVNPGGSEVNGCTGSVYPSELSCGGTIEPKFRIRNNGTDHITSLVVGYKLNNGSAVTQTLSLNLSPGASTVISFPTTAVTQGNNEFKFFTSSPNGVQDPVTANDTLIAHLNIQTPTAPYINEGFEYQFPPEGWSIHNPEKNITWQRVPPGKNSTYSAFFDNFDNDVVGQTDDLRTPSLITDNVTSIKISFDLAHKNYSSNGNHDTLSILASTDCGNSYTTIYKKWGTALSTAGTSDSYYTNPSQSDWRRETIDLNGPLLEQHNVLFVFRNTNRYGNNIYIDNVLIDPLFKRDVELVSIVNPGTLICENNITPSITVRNKGIETITNLKISYKVDNGNIQTTSVNNINLTSGAQTNIQLPTSTVNGTGSHQITVYAWDLTTVQGTGDMLLLNDTLRKEFSLAGIVKDSIKEDFEKLQFPPANWSRVNNDGNITWSRINMGRISSGSAYMNNYNYESFGEKDDLFTPLFQFNKSDSLILSFDLSAAVFSTPTTKDIPIDTLEVLVSKDCGNTFTTVYKKWGAALQTLNNPNNGYEQEFFPSSDNQWRRERIDLSNFASGGTLLFGFRSTNNWENNIFLDNISVITKNVPQLLKEKGYLVTSTSDPDKFNVWHLEVPKNLRVINVYNSNGQLVWQQQYNSNASNIITVDLSGKPAGIYIISMGYTGNNNKVSERIIKR